MATKRFMLHGPKASLEAEEEDGSPLWNNDNKPSNYSVLSWNNGDEITVKGEPIASSSTLNIDDKLVAQP